MGDEINLEDVRCRDLIDRKLVNDKGLVVDVESIFIGKDQILVRDRESAKSYSLIEHKWFYQE